MSDPTLETLAKFDDPAQWDLVTDNVPIFMEHEAWETQDGDGRKSVVIVYPGETPPEDARFLYRVDLDALQSTATAINRNLRENGKAIKVFLGHSKPALPQKDQPPLVGFCVGAKIGPWGPRGKMAILSRQLIKRGCFEDVKDCPERSPEFYPGRNEITGLALLKTDPRLPMGMVTYAGEDLRVCYQRGFDDMAEDKKPGDEKPNPNAGTPDPSKDSAPSPEPDPAGTPKADATLTPEEQATVDKMVPYLASKLVAHLAAHDPIYKYCAQCYDRDNQKPPQADETPPPGQEKETPSSETPEGEGEADDDDGLPDDNPRRTDMSKDNLLEQRLQAVEAENAKLRQDYAVAESTRIVGELTQQGYRIKDPAKEITRMAGLTKDGRAERAEEIRQNYQKDEPPPVGGSFVNTRSGTEGGTGKEPEYEPGKDQASVVNYCEENGLDVSNDAHWAKAIKAVLEKKKAG